MRRTIVIASANRDKSVEIRAILRAVLDDEVELLDRPPEVPEVAETGATLEENARLKARALCSATGHAAVADDTGLEVAVLDGAPGVYSARYAGERATYAQNVAAVLEALNGARSRVARFRTVALVTFPDGRELLAEGSLDGSIVFEPKGSNGFGYDPIFVPLGGDGRTLAELAPEEKDALSHRGRAFRALATKLREVALND